MATVLNWLKIKSVAGLPGVIKKLGTWVWGRIVGQGCWWYGVREDSMVLLDTVSIYSDQPNDIVMVVLCCHPGMLWGVWKGKSEQYKILEECKSDSSWTKTCYSGKMPLSFVSYFRRVTPQSWICPFCMIRSQQTFSNDHYHATLDQIYLNLWIYTVGKINTICQMWLLN